MTGNKKRERHEFVQYGARLTADEHEELMILADVLMLKGKIRKKNPYNITHYALMILKQKLSDVISKATTSKGEPKDGVPVVQSHD